MECQIHQRLSDAPRRLRDHQWDRIKDLLPGRVGLPHRGCDHILWTRPTSGFRAAPREPRPFAEGKWPVFGVSSMLTILKSRKIVDAAIQRARELNANISVAVCGRGGRLIVFSRMDGCRGWDLDRSAIGMAAAAAITGRPSNQLSDRLPDGVRIVSYTNAVPPRGQRGGLPIMEEDVVEGGCGVSGATTLQENEECARAGIEALDTTETEPTHADRVPP
jgi:uncharacterized protein GlcG (DUF336 family)